MKRKNRSTPSPNKPETDTRWSSSSGTSAHRRSGLVAGVGMSLMATMLALLMLEASFRLLHIPGSEQNNAHPSIALHIPKPDKRYLYGLNPDHPEINEQGLRNRPFSTDKEPGVRRILFLGDSITYGPQVAGGQTFPALIEERLQGEQRKIEILNGGIKGYTPYNERFFYLDHCRAFEPDVVVVVFCLNDIVDPFLHWRFTHCGMPLIPNDAVPNIEYHISHNLPHLERTRKRNRRPRTILEQTSVYRFASPFFWKISDRSRNLLNRYTWYQGKFIPSYLTGETAVSIECLLDTESAEWRWLRRQYLQMKQEIERDGVRFAVVLTPLSYQLDPAYPLSPQPYLVAFCAQNDIPCLDLLPAFQQPTDTPLYLGRHHGYLDIWHLSPTGHLRAAQEITAFLRLHNLI